MRECRYLCTKYKSLYHIVGLLFYNGSLSQGTLKDKYEILKGNENKDAKIHVPLLLYATN